MDYQGLIPPRQPDVFRTDAFILLLYFFSVFCVCVFLTYNAVWNSEYLVLRHCAEETKRFVTGPEGSSLSSGGPKREAEGCARHGPALHLCL